MGGANQKMGGASQEMGGAFEKMGGASEKMDGAYLWMGGVVGVDVPVSKFASDITQSVGLAAHSKLILVDRKGAAFFFFSL